MLAVMGASPRVGAAQEGDELDIRRLEAQKLVEDADKATGEPARKLYLRAGQAYADLWLASAEACKRGVEKACLRGEELVYNAARAFQAGHDFERSAMTRALLFDTKNFKPGSPLVARAMYEQGALFQAVAEYEKAADLYERFVDVAPKDERAPTALSDAIVLRLGLGERERAREDAEKFERLYAQSQATETAKVQLAIATSLSEEKKSDAVVKYLTGRRDRIVKGLPTQAPVVDVMLAEALLATGKKKASTEAYTRAVSIKASSLVSPDMDATAMRMLGKALVAIGKARLALAEPLAAEAFEMKVAKGDVDALKKKRAAVEHAADAYVAVLNIQPEPPPGPLIEAASIVARMYSQLWAQAYLAFGDETAEPFHVQARAANLRCVDLSMKYEWTSPAARACAVWLARHFPHDVSTITEPMPKANWVVATPHEAPKPRPEDAEPSDASPPISRPASPAAGASNARRRSSNKR